MAGVLDVAPGALPPVGTKRSRLLAALLRGEKIDPPAAFIYNLTTVHARAAELRRQGWPVCTMMLPHPHVAGEEYPVYHFDDHFLRWAKGRKVVEPVEYKHNTGRGRFRVPG